MNKMIKIVFGIFAVLALWGCAASKPAEEINWDDILLFPMPPETPRIQYLTHFSTSSDIQEFSRLDQFLLGKSLMELEVAIDKPYGIAMHDGKIYICDTMLPGLVVIDLEKKTLKPFQPFGQGTLRKPVNLAVDQAGYIYVADTQRNQVVVFTPELKYFTTYASQSMKPLDVAIRGDTLLIADYEDRNVEVWSIRQKRMVSIFPPDNEHLPDSVRIFVPYAVEFDSHGNIFITDYGQFRVQKFSPRGEFLRSFGELGRNLGQFARPKGIAIDRDDVLYVIDAAFENAQMFDQDGNLLMFIGGPYEREGNMYLPASITIDYDHLAYFQDRVLPGFDLKYLILVTNQYGPDKITVYGRIEPREGTDPDSLEVSSSNR
ncbi:MAG: hypothetical protein D6762_09235 [Candidatus Neomarinimicrobiota bacterium]|nr:MAG: hypothetical protein D6762_09235 [Candidatus Neomarinimicrobiota bacterium]